MNQPNHKPCQKFVFQHPYEAKHAIGKLHKKRLEFESREGISEVKFVEGRGWKDEDNRYGRFTIHGKAAAVDALMAEIAEWLDKCQMMHESEKFIVAAAPALLKAFVK